MYKIVIMVAINYITFTRKILLIAVISLLLIINNDPELSAQRISNDTPPLRERLFFGGDFGLQFGTITNIEIAPIIGLWVLPRLAVAAGPEYNYYARKNIGSTNIYGARAYTQFVIVQDLNNILPAGIHLGLFLHAEDEFQSLQTETPFWINTNVDTERFTVNTFLVGGGISQPMGRRAAINLTFLWALEDNYGLYSNPEIRVSFVF